MINQEKSVNLTSDVFSYLKDSINPNPKINDTMTKSQNTNISSIQIIKEKINYKYIDEDELMKNFNICLNENQYNIHYCIYSINTDCYIEGIPVLDENLKLHDTEYLYNNFQPFIQYVFKKENNSFVFPSNSYECKIFGDNDQNIIETDKSQEQIHFENDCLTKLYEFFDNDIINIIHNEKININEFYKGFIQDEENKQDIYVFFNVTTIINYLKKTEYTIAIIDEIIYKKKIYSTPIHDSVISFFKKNDQFTKIYLLDNENNSDMIEVLFPFQLYLCSYNDDTYKNIEKSEKLIPYEHPKLGLCYLFSTFPLIETYTENLKRFSCFMVNELYLKNNISSIMNEEEKESEEEENIKDDILIASTIYFRNELEIQLWGIKNISHFIEY